VRKFTDTLNSAAPVRRRLMVVRKGGAAGRSPSPACRPPLPHCVRERDQAARCGSSWLRCGRPEGAGLGCSSPPERGRGGPIGSVRGWLVVRRWGRRGGNAPLTGLPATSPPLREGEGSSGEVAVLLAELRRTEGTGLGAGPRPRNGGEVAR